MTPDDTPIIERPLLDLNDKQTPIWRKLRDHYEKRLQELRVLNDNDLDAISTARLRGRIQQVRELLALGDQDPAHEVNED